jgi:hypothetical protein
MLLCLWMLMFYIDLLRMRMGYCHDVIVVALIYEPHPPFVVYWGASPTKEDLSSACSS